jgi:hypothetical protein
MNLAMLEINTKSVDGDERPVRQKGLDVELSRLV